MGTGRPYLGGPGGEAVTRPAREQGSRRTEGAGDEHTATPIEARARAVRTALAALLALSPLP